MSKHTPGPWKIANHCSTLIFDTNDRSVASAGGYQNNKAYTLDENEANTNLIAAAPDLLEALEAMLNKAYKQNWNDNYPDQVAQAQAAVDKARGES